MKIEKLANYACWDSAIEIKCPICNEVITAEPDTTDLYCEECKRIVMQNPLTEQGFI